MEPRRVRIRGEAQAPDPVGADAFRLLEDEDHVARRETEDLADAATPHGRPDLAAQLGDVRRGEVQTFSPSTS
jgi:hypothetical protein